MTYNFCLKHMDTRLSVEFFLDILEEEMEFCLSKERVCCCAWSPIVQKKSTLELVDTRLNVVDES